MTTVSVWVLVIYMGSSVAHHGGPAIIDNIANKDECVRVQEIMQRQSKTEFTQCVEIKKIKHGKGDA